MLEYKGEGYLSVEGWEEVNWGKIICENIRRFGIVVYLKK